MGRPMLSARLKGPRAGEGEGVLGEGEVSYGIEFGAFWDLKSHQNGEP